MALAAVPPVWIAGARTAARHTRSPRTADGTQSPRACARRPRPPSSSQGALQGAETCTPEMSAFGAPPGHTVPTRGASNACRARSPMPAFASTFVVPRSHPGPRRQARRGAKTTHIRPVSARISRAAVMSTPGMLSSCAIWPTFKGVWSATANFAPCHPLIPGLVNSHSITNDQMVVLDAMNLAARCPFYKFAASNAGERL